jgi:ABC-type oligopeptide transport system ATPase subunit
MSLPLLRVEDLSVEYRSRWRAAPVRALDHVSLEISTGETLGLVGESGSGKTTLGGAVLGLVPPSAGKIIFDGKEITRASKKERHLLAKDLQVVFQDPYSSLNPSRTIGQTLAEPLIAQASTPRPERTSRVKDMLSRVGLPAEAFDRYPAQFSGGQRQRIAIARALMANPKLVICDEPSSALDLSVQAQILNLLKDLQEELGLAYLFISHDLAVVRHISHRIAVINEGHIVETGSAVQVCTEPRHPYTKELLSAAPVPDPAAQAARRTARRRRLLEQTLPAGVVPASQTGAQPELVVTERGHDDAAQGTGSPGRDL